MNIQELQDTITSKYARHAADIMDGAAFAYVTAQLANIKAQGKDPADYEVVMCRDEGFRRIEKEDGTSMIATNYIRLERRRDIENLPILRDSEDTE